MKTKFAIAAVLAAATTLPAIAQTPTTPTPAAIEQMELAATLARYGEERQDPVLMLAAARIAKNISPEAPVGDDTLPTMNEMLDQAAEYAGDNDYISAEVNTLRTQQSKAYCYGPYGLGWC